MQSDHMPPHRAVEDAADDRNTYSVLSGQSCFVAEFNSSVRPDLTNMMVFKFGPSVLHPLARSASAFTHSVPIIIAICSQKQMRRVAARTIIAFVKDAKAVWNWAFGKFKSSSMRSHNFFLPSKLTVAVPARTHPRPTFIWRPLLHFCPKPVWICIFFTPRLREHLVDFRASSLRIHSSEFMQSFLYWKGISCLPN